MNEPCPLLHPRARCAAFACALLAMALGCEPRLPIGSLDRCLFGLHSSEGVSVTEQKLGQRFALEHYYYRWDTSWPGALENQVRGAGRIPVVSWSGLKRDGTFVTWKQIADPNDAAVQLRLKTVADGVRTYRDRIYVVFDIGADQDVSSGTAADFVAAWRRVVEVFRAQGADNAVWVWALSSGAFSGQADSYYPGDDVVDWIGVAGFNSSPEWKSFQDLFAPFHRWSASRGKPAMVVEFSSGEDGANASSKSAWLGQIVATLESWPEVQAVLYWNEAGPNAPIDSPIDSSPPSLEAFRALVANPYFDATGRTLISR